MNTSLFDIQVNGFAGVDFQQPDLSAADQPMRDAPILVSRTDSRIPRVLLAEDCGSCQKYFHIVLKQSGLKVDIVCNGKEAIQALSKTEYALVLMDCLMPTMGGAEATRLIRTGNTSARDPEIPIIAITADAFPTNEDACKRAGMDDFITKPVRVATLREVIQKWLAAEPEFKATDSKNRTIYPAFAIGAH